MDKDTKQSDTMSVSTISNGGYNYETPPPAYQSKKSTAVALAKIAATTILAAAFILGAFIVAASYVSALSKCSCPKPDSHHHVTSHKLPEAASFVGLQQIESQNGLSKLQEKPKMKEEKEISIPIAVTTTTETAPPAEEDEEPLPEEPLFGDEEATENEVTEEGEEEPAGEQEQMQQRIMDLLKKMVEIDPSMRGNMKCRVSKKNILPFEPRGALPNRPILQVHCTKAVIRPLPGPFNPFAALPKVMRLPSPLTSSGILRMQRPPILPLNGLAAPDIPQPPGLFNKPQGSDLKIPMMMKLLANMPLLPRLPAPQTNTPIRRLDNVPFSQFNDLEQPQEEEEQPFPFFPERKIIPLDTQQRAPNARFIVPFRKGPIALPNFPLRDEEPEESLQQPQRRIIKLPLPFLPPIREDQSFSPRILPFGRPLQNDLPRVPEQNLVPPREEQNQDAELDRFPVRPPLDEQNQEPEPFPFFRPPQPPQNNEQIHPIPLFQGPPPQPENEPQIIPFAPSSDNRQEQDHQPANFLRAPEPQGENLNLPIPFFRPSENEEEERQPIPFFQGPPPPENEQPQQHVPFFQPEPQQDSQQPIRVPIPFFPQQDQPQHHVNEPYAPQFNAPELNHEEQAPPAPQGPIAIPLTRNEQHSPQSFPDPLSIIDKIRNLQNVQPPQPVSPRTYHLNQHTIPDGIGRGNVEPPVEISAPHQQPEQQQ